MHVIKDNVLAGVQSNLDLFKAAETDARETNIAAVKSAAEGLVDHVVTGTPNPVVQVVVAPSDRIEPLQAFSEKVEVLAPDENGAIAITDYEFENFVRDQVSSVVRYQVKLVMSA